MTKRTAFPALLALGIGLAVTFVAPTAAHAQRKSPLADAPAIRRRVELRASRFELGVAFGSSLNETFYHDIMLNVRAGFHINDWLSVSGLAGFTVTTLSTGFHDRLISSLPPMTLPADNDDRRAPSQTSANSALNKPASLFAAQVEVTPFTGKFALFSKLFAHYDFYVFGGPAYLNLAAAGSGADACTDGDGNQASETHILNRVCVVKGGQFGGTFGLGFHSFVNDFVAINVELRDVLVKDNPAGRDVNGDQFATNKDLTWTSHVFAFIGATVHFPLTPSITD